MNKLDEILDSTRFKDKEDGDLLIATWAILIADFGSTFEPSDFYDICRDAILTCCFYGDKSLLKHLHGSLSKNAITAWQITLKELDNIRHFEARKQHVLDRVAHIAENLEDIKHIEYIKAVKIANDALHNLDLIIEKIKNDQVINRIESSSQTAQILGLPMLTGTLKQRVWAEDIRRKCLERMTEEEIKPLLKRKTARYWIDNHKEILNKSCY